MPYSEWDEVNAAIKGIEPRVTLAQADKIAEWADSMDSDEVENVWAAAIAQFKRLYTVEDGSWVKKQAEASEFLFTEFEEGKPVEFLRIGTFVDRNGREVEITQEFLDDLVASFEAGQAGQEVPIDVKHEKGEAAGWVARVWREGSRLLATVDWNALGTELIGERVYRYLSATIDTAQNVLKSISLVNFPAVKGLQPVELAEGAYTMKLKGGLLQRVQSAIKAVFEEVEAEELEVEEEEELEQEETETEGESEEEEMGEQELEELREEIRAELLAEMEEEKGVRAELEEEVRAEIQAELEEQMERKRELAEFAEEVCGGDAGLSTDPDELVELMVPMDEERLEKFQEVIRGKIVEFEERGSSRDGMGDKAELEAPYKSQIREWLDAGRDLEEWFEMNEDVVGPMDDYNVAEFMEEEE